MTASRLPLTRIFNGEREYLFTTKRNVRNFEWGRQEVEDLFESILALEEENDEQLELNTMTIMPTAISAEEQLELGGASVLYDVHDGQQRLVALSLLLAALRDNIVVWQHEFGDEFWEDALEVSRSIHPSKPRMQDIDRVQVRDRTSSWLHRILSNSVSTTARGDLLNAPLELPAKRNHLSTSERLILEAYDYMYERIEFMGPTKALDTLLDNFMTKVHVILCIPETTRIARNMVMGLGKGKNLEPVDEFKGMVCFRPSRKKIDKIITWKLGTPWSNKWDVKMWKRPALPFRKSTCASQSNAMGKRI